MSEKNIGKLLLKYRRDNNMTQSELGEKLNVSDKTISRWERDERLPDIESLKLISDLLNVTLDELYSSNEKLNSKETKIKNKREHHIKFIKIKYLILTILTIIILLLLIFVINNYKKCNVYLLADKSQKFNMNGVLIIEPDENILIISNINLINDEELENKQIYDYQYQMYIDNELIYQSGDVLTNDDSEYSEKFIISEMLNNIRLFQIEKNNKFNIKKDISIIITYINEDLEKEEFIIQIDKIKRFSNDKLSYK